MTFTLVVVFGIGLLLLVSGLEDTSISATFRAFAKGDMPANQSGPEHAQMGIAN